MDCAESSCSGSSGCDTIVSYKQRRACLAKNCQCDIGPEKAEDASNVPITPCVQCGTINQCNTYDVMSDREACLVKNCGVACQNIFDNTTPKPSTEHYIYFPYTRIV